VECDKTKKLRRPLVRITGAAIFVRKIFDAFVRKIFDAFVRKIFDAFVRKIFDAFVRKH
jgi:hypothetical protein